MAGAASAAPETNSHSGATALNPGVAGAKPPLVTCDLQGESSCGAILEPGGRKITECRVQSMPIVDALQEIPDTGEGFLEIAIFVAVDLFVFQGLHEGLASRVVVGVALAAHADLGLVL